MKHLPNLLTGLRLALALFVFVALVAAGGDVGRLGAWTSRTGAFALERWALFAFVLAAASDFFDGWLARRLGATSLWGAILDPIADKVLVCAAVLGLLALRDGWVALPGGLILFREFAVSALREVLAGKGLRLPVTILAKWKTTIQLAALAAALFAANPPAFGVAGGAMASALGAGALALLWLAAVLTLVTGAQYLAQACRALSAP
ncbi:MAG TPA: CDP-diacylglycerol--glycerol-3-phosphate 3-phosphatidyltransferase [Caulobacteraceae bacterium]|nr:CDP-diacylglycerol--glycerol-3-phosphate 3-phosphatidyltransferase [Caulobacteraceae bacterium]